MQTIAEEVVGRQNTKEIIGRPFDYNVPNTSTDKPFIIANTIPATLEEIRNDHIIPVFIKDNETVISHTDFIEVVNEVVQDIYSHEVILKPNIRLSHPIKGRVPEAKDKPANALLEHEKTLYYERMMFVIELPSVQTDVDGNMLTLTIGGVKALNLDNLYSRKGSDEHFKIFVGFKNTVCTNLCVWSDGFMGDLKVNTLGELKSATRIMLENYNGNYHQFGMKELSKLSITEKQFATLIGKCRMYQHLPYHIKNSLPQMLFGDTQLNLVCKDYYKDESFCRDDAGNINLWRLYNLFTGANKTSYIDNFLDRNVNAYHFVEKLRFALQDGSNSWFLN